MSNQPATPATPATPAPYVRPNLNRPKIQSMVEGIPLLDLDAFARYRLALKQFRFEPGKKNNPYYIADVLILEVKQIEGVLEAVPKGVAKPAPKLLPLPERWVAGTMTSLYFATGRAGTATNPGKPDYDDAYLTAAVRAFNQVQRGQPFDAEKGLDELITAGKIETDAVQIWFERQPAPKLKEVLHPIDGSVLATAVKVYNKDRFEAMPPAVETLAKS